ncbi:AMP-binding protein [Streptomyces seoulensis]|uniref:Fatty acid--CoA ligase n=1 Tax=Streptomyces seoulensis TaxID=73044 RepID=A0A4P6TZV6_STRSO|nr:AMP-binding protein [Streptomyces seoulensis]QBJ93335.1 fatty acid--CoA ligase [Streptomyces seoulensis]
MPDVAAPRFRNPVEDILDALRENPGREALVHGEHRLSAGEFRELVHRMAWAMQAQGIERGQTVTLLSGNLPEAMAVRYAANLIGAQVNHLYSKLSAEVQAAIVADVETRALVVDPRLADRAAEITASVPVKSVLTLGPWDSADDLLELAAGQSAEPFPSRAEPDDICGIRHTGGTTGHPKGICTTFRQVQETRSARPVTGEETGEHRQLVATTIAHAAGMLADAVLETGGTVVLLDDFDPAEVLRTVERERISHMWLLPPLLYQLLDHPDMAHTDTSSLRQVLYGGCQSSPTRIADAVRRLGPVLMQGYGQNEGGIISVLPQQDHDPDDPALLRTAGKVLPSVDVEIRDPEGNVLPNGEHGEICVRSAMVMQGYWKQPRLTAEVLQDGWLHTGDVGFLDDAGYLTVVDRLKDMIVVVGGHVYTTELEDLLNTHPDVLQSAVFGVRDEDRMERVHAAVLLAPGATTTAEDLRALVRAERGAMYEPARITFPVALPLTDVGKPDKKELRRRATP